MKRFRRILCAALSAALLLGLTGCWNYREAESLYIISAAALDKGSGGHKYRLTFEVLDLAGQNGQSGGLPAKVLTAEGDTIADAVKAASENAENELYFNDCRIVIFSTALAEEGLTPLLDWINRDPEPGFTTQLYVSRERTAGELLGADVSGGVSVGYHVADCMEQAAPAGRCPLTALYQADKILLGEGKELLLPCLRIGAAGGTPRVELSGSAVFRGDRCAGFLTEDETAADLLVISAVSDGLLLTGEPGGAKNLSLVIQKSGPSLKPLLSGAQPAMSVALTAECVFDEENTPRNLLAERGADYVEKLAEDTLRSQSAAEIARVQRVFGCDIYGFGRKISQTDPALWAALKPRWSSVFRSMKVTVTAKVHINNSGFAFPKGR